MNCLFYIRRKIDFDYMVPILYRLSDDPGTAVFLYGDVDLSMLEDPQARPLWRRPNVRLTALLWHYPWPLRRVSQSWLIRKLLGVFERFPKLNGRVKALCKKVSTETVVEMLAALDVTAVMTGTNKLRHGVMSPLMNAASLQSIPLISVPHAIDIINLSDEEYAKVEPGQFDHFDLQIIPNEVRLKYLLATGHDRKKMLILGSARGARSWLKYRLEYLDAAPLDAKVKQNKLKIVIFDRAPEPEKEELYLSALDRLANLGFAQIALKIKPGNDLSANYLREINKSITVYRDRDTLPFSVWADVIIGSSTTALIEPLALGTPVIYMSHVSSYEPNYASFGACILANNDEHLHNLLLEIHEKGSERLQRHDAIEDYLIRFVEADQPNTDIAKRYADCIRDFSSSF